MLKLCNILIGPKWVIDKFVFRLFVLYDFGTDGLLLHA